MKATVVYPKTVFNQEHDRVMEIDVPDDCKPDGVFRMMNAVDGSDIEKQLRQHKCRSMSAGDYVKLNGTWLKCEMIGWQEVTNPEEIAKLEAMKDMG